jgi:hypothetical protein
MPGTGGQTLKSKGGPPPCGSSLLLQMHLPVPHTTLEDGCLSIPEFLKTSHVYQSKPQGTSGQHWNPSLFVLFKWEPCFDFSSNIAGNTGEGPQDRVGKAQGWELKRAEFKTSFLYLLYDLNKSRNLSESHLYNKEMKLDWSKVSCSPTEDSNLND